MTKLHHRKLARVFPAYHPRKGESTYFVEKLYRSILVGTDYVPITGIEQSLSLLALADAAPKHHTIRAGNHVQPGDFIRFSVWSDKPYQSKPVVIAPDIEVVRTWNFSKDALGGKFRINGKEIYPAQLEQIANNDGLSIGEFMSWFNKPFTGQIICWNKTVNYDLTL